MGFSKHHKRGRSGANGSGQSASSGGDSGGLFGRLRQALRGRSYDAGRELVSPAGGVGAQADHAALHTASADQIDAGLQHVPSGVGANVHAENAKLHHTDVHDAQVQLGGDGLDAHAGQVSWLNTGASALNASVDSQNTGHAAALNGSNIAVHDTQVQDANLHLGRRGLNASAAHVGFKNVAADHLDAGVRSDTGRGAGASADGLRIHDTSVDGASLNADATGARAHADGVSFENLAADQVNLSARGRHAEVAAQAQGLSVHHTQVQNADVAANRSGLDVRSDEVSFANMQADRVQGEAKTAGGSSAQASASDLNVHKLGVKDANVHMGSGGIQAQANEVNWLNTGMSDAKASWAGGDGAHGNASLDALAVHQLAVQDGRFSLDRDGVAASGAVDYTHAQVDGLEASHQTAGGTQLKAGVDHATIGAASADRLALETNLLKGKASIDGGKVVEHDLRGASISVGRGGETALGARGDLRAQHGVDHAEASWDLLQGRAGASVQGYTHDRSLSNASLNILAEQIEIPELALHIEADASAEVDISDGELDLGLDLSGSEIRIGDFSMTLPEQAQLGVDIDLSQGEVNLNIGGHEIDVDRAVGRFWGELKGLFGGGKGDKAGASEIQRGRDAVRGLKRTVPRLKDDVVAASRLAQARKAA